MSLRRFSFLLIIGAMIPATAGDGWLVHLIPNQRGFQSDIVLYNPGANRGEVSLFLRGEDMHVIPVEARQTLTLRSTRLGDFTHLRYHTRQELIEVGIQYRTRDGARLTVSMDRESAKVHRFRWPSDPNIWLGLAAVNDGDAPTPIALRQYDAEERLLFEQRLAAEMQPGQKLLKVLTDMELSPRPESSIEIVANQPLVITMLAGHVRTGTLFELQPTGSFNDRIVATVRGGFLGLEETVEIEAGDLRFKGRTVPFSEIGTSLERLRELGAADLRIDAIPDACCDMRFYGLTFVQGDARNEFFFSDLDLDQGNEAARAGWEALRYVFELAQEETGEDSLAF